MNAAPGVRQAPDAGAVGLYAGVVRGRASDLPGTIRRFHFGVGNVHGVGTVDVRRGETALARAIGWVLRLPPGGDSVPLDVIVVRLPEGEEWLRCFWGRPLHSRQFARHGAIVERFGPLELMFRVKVSGAALVMASAGATLWLWRIRVPLPRLLCPRVCASVTAPQADGVLAICVRVRAPLAGLVLAYEGAIEEVMR